MEIKIVFSVDHTIMQFLREKLGNIEHKLNVIIEKEKLMADDIQGIKDDLTTQNQALQKVVADVATILQDAEKLLGQVGTGQPVDPAAVAEIRQALQSQTASLNTLSEQLEAEDVKINPPAPPVA